MWVWIVAAMWIASAIAVIAYCLGMEEGIRHGREVAELEEQLRAIERCYAAAQLHAQTRHPIYIVRPIRFVGRAVLN